MGIEIQEARKKLDILERLAAERKQYFYNKQIELQNFYKENASIQIKKIREKQKEIAEYLKSLGYIEGK